MRRVERKGRWHGRWHCYPGADAVPRIGLLVLVDGKTAKLEIEISGGPFYFNSVEEVDDFRGLCVAYLERAQIDADRGPPPLSEAQIREWNERVVHAWRNKGEAY